MGSFEIKLFKAMDSQTLLTYAVIHLKIVTRVFELMFLTSSNLVGRAVVQNYISETTGSGSAASCHSCEEQEASFDTASCIYKPDRLDAGFDACDTVTLPSPKMMEINFNLDFPEAWISLDVT